MSNKEEEEKDTTFSGFGFLTGDAVPAPAAETKKEVKAPKKEETLASDELTVEELEALDQAAAAQAKPKTEKKVKEVKKVEAEEEEELEEETPIIEAVAEEEEEEEENTFSAYARYMADKGILDLEDDTKVESEDDLEKVQIKTIQNGINSYKESIPEDGQKFLEFLEQGGNPSDFHKYYYGDDSFEEFDIEDSEENQKYVISESLKLEGYSQEEIDDEIADLIDLGKLDKKAKTHKNKLVKIEKEQKKLLLESQKQYAKEQEEARQAEWTNFKKGLFDKEEISGFKFTPKMKQDVWDYMTKPVNKKTGVTQYQIDSQENTDARYVFAYLLKNKWDIKSLEKQVETKTVGKLKSALNNYSDSKFKAKSPKSKLQKEDNLENPFKNFKHAL